MNIPLVLNLIACGINLGIYLFTKNQVNLICAGISGIFALAWMF